MDRKQKKEFLIIAVGLLVLLSCMSFLLRSCSDQKAKQAQKNGEQTNGFSLKKSFPMFILLFIIAEMKKSTKRPKSNQKINLKEDDQLRDLDGNEIKNKDIPKPKIQ